jgi:hypothetical protein
MGQVYGLFLVAATQIAQTTGENGGGPRSRSIGKRRTPMYRRPKYLQHFNHPIVTLARCHQEELVRQAKHQRRLDQAGASPSEATPAWAPLRRWLGTWLRSWSRVGQPLDRPVPPGSTTRPAGSGG